MKDIFICDIIIPTYNNMSYLFPCVNSIFQNTVDIPFRVIIVNNGEPEHMSMFKDEPRIIIHQEESNVGWEGGLKDGLKISDSPYVVFMNDDTFIPQTSRDWLSKLMKNFSDPNCSAVGPSSNVVMGRQNIFSQINDLSFRSKYLIGFCMVIKREDLDSSGGVDETLPGGDDLDLSIRLRDLGKYLIVDRDVFVYHHGFKTGERVEGSPSTTNGWNSIEKIERTNFALINKHGIHKFLDLWKA
jgi:GT2 family glycosyltransferase